MRENGRTQAWLACFLGGHASDVDVVGALIALAGSRVADKHVCCSG